MSAAVITADALTRAEGDAAERLAMARALLGVVSAPGAIVATVRAVLRATVGAAEIALAAVPGGVLHGDGPCHRGAVDAATDALCTFALAYRGPAVSALASALLGRDLDALVAEVGVLDSETTLADSIEALRVLDMLDGELASTRGGAR